MVTAAVNGQGDKRMRSRKLTGGYLKVILLFSITLFNSAFCRTPREGKEVKMVREPVVAGQFYPDNKETLARVIRKMLAEANPPAIDGEVVGIQVPHAGVEYSGRTAAFAYKLLEGMDSVTVIMFGPSHRATVNNAAVFSSGVWRTPLGDIEVDEKLARALIKEDGYFADLPSAHNLEHSLEVQLPFLQMVLKNFKIVPIMLLFPSYEQCERAGKAVARVAQGKRVILLASSDLYHGYSYTEAKATDSATVALMKRFDPGAFYQAVYKSYVDDKPVTCGGYPIVAMMVAARAMGASRTVLLHQTNSNDVLNQRGGYCVGYSAMAFLAPARTGEKKTAASEGDLTRAEQERLLAIARKAIEEYVRNGRVPDFEPGTERLKEKRGVFVTLHKYGQLRGCIGYVEPIKPVYLATRDMAISAATEDPRFPPVTREELDDIDIEITVLSPLQRIDRPEQVEVGRHGLVIRKGFYSGLLLPQVPIEQGWDRRQFLEHTCLKAGLPPDAWKDPNAQLYVFTGQVFGEGELKSKRREK